VIHECQDFLSATQGESKVDEGAFL
jgi:hypothetical protein